MDNQVIYTLCPMCGKKIKAGVKFCPQCSEPFIEQAPPKRVCPNCGRAATGEKFCSECGTAMQAPGNETKTKQPPLQDQPTPKDTAQERPPIVELSDKMGQGEFFERYAKKLTKNWVKFLPWLGFFSVAVYFTLMIIMFAGGNGIGGAFMIFDVLCIGSLSYMMHTKKQAAYFIAFAVYNGIASVLAFIDMDFSNMLWLVASIYAAVKMWKIEQAYRTYLATGALPLEEI